MVAHAVAVCVSLVGVVDVGAIVALVEDIWVFQGRNGSTLSLALLSYHSK